MNVNANGPNLNTVAINVASKSSNYSANPATGNATIGNA
jgi:hypothetical protein